MLSLAFGAGLVLQEHTASLFQAVGRMRVSALLKHRSAGLGGPPGLEVGDRVRFRADGPGRVVMERIEVPATIFDVAAPD